VGSAVQHSFARRSLHARTHFGFCPAPIYNSTASRRRRIVLRTEAAACVLTDQAPPAMTFMHVLFEQRQMPTAVRFTEFLKQNGHVYRACCAISIFFTCFRNDEPYRVPYFPTTPTFRVRLPIAESSQSCRRDRACLYKSDRLNKSCIESVICTPELD
jgi:hypothetical protein